MQMQDLEWIIFLSGPLTCQKIVYWVEASRPLIFLGGGGRRGSNFSEANLGLDLRASDLGL